MANGRKSNGRTMLKTRMTRRSRISRRAKKTAKTGFSIGKKIFPIAKNLSAPIAFIEQISAKHRQTLGTAYSNAPLGQKMKILTNIVLGSTTGLNPFKNEFQAPLSQLKISNIFNKWTTAGVALIGYSIIAKQANKALGNNIMPAIAPLRAIGKQVLIGGALGGILDDRASYGNNTTYQGTANIMATSSNNMMMYNNGSSNDSTESGVN